MGISIKGQTIETSCSIITFDETVSCNTYYIHGYRLQCIETRSPATFSQYCGVDHGTTSLLIQSSPCLVHLVRRSNPLFAILTTSTSYGSNTTSAKFLYDRVSGVSVSRFCDSRMDFREKRFLQQSKINSPPVSMPILHQLPTELLRYLVHQYSGVHRDPMQEVREYVISEESASRTDQTHFQMRRRDRQLFCPPVPRSAQV